MRVDWKGGLNVIRYMEKVAYVIKEETSQPHSVWQNRLQKWQVGNSRYIPKKKALKQLPFLEPIFPFQAGYLPQAATRIMLAVEHGDLGTQFVTGSILPSL